MCVRWVRGRFQLDDKLKDLIRELGAAINDALSESGQISDALQNVRNAGYDVFLVLEATIGFNKRPANVEGSVELDPAAVPSGTAKLKVTSHDLKWLQSLKISVEDLNEH